MSTSRFGHLSNSDDGEAIASRLRGLVNPGQNVAAHDIEGLDPEFARRINRMFENAPQHVRDQMRPGGIGINDGYRTEADQERLRGSHGGLAAAGLSNHQLGIAMDINGLSTGRVIGQAPNGRDIQELSAAGKWFHENAAAYGLKFPMSWERWHVEIDRGFDASRLPPSMPDAYRDARAIAGSAETMSLQSMRFTENQLKAVQTDLNTLIGAGKIPGQRLAVDGRLDPNDIRAMAHFVAYQKRLDGGRCPSLGSANALVTLVDNAADRIEAERRNAQQMTSRGPAVPPLLQRRDTNLMGARPDLAAAFQRPGIMPVRNDLLPAFQQGRGPVAARATPDRPARSRLPERDATMQMFNIRTMRFTREEGEALQADLNRMIRSGRLSGQQLEEDGRVGPKTMQVLNQFMRQETAGGRCPLLRNPTDLINHVDRAADRADPRGARADATAHPVRPR